MSCLTGNLESIKAPSSTTPCGCDCDLNDITISSNYECIGATAGQTLSDFFTELEETICDLNTSTAFAGSSWCVPGSNLPIPPATATFQELMDFIAAELLPISGNSCDCPIKNDLYFEDGQGIRQCEYGVNFGELMWGGDIGTWHSNEQNRSTADLKISRGLSAGINVPASASTLNLATVAPSQLQLTYRINAKSNNVAVTLPELGDVDAYNEHRLIVLKRVDNCNTTYAVTVSPFSGETIEGASSKVLPRGHSWVLHGDASDGEWSIIADYTEMCESGGEIGTVGVAETEYVNTSLIGLTTADFLFFVDGLKVQFTGTNAAASFTSATGTITYLTTFTAGVERQLAIINPI